jgi:phospholipid/cholesterol/gamma-HCH transport system substrate-binding protein
MISRSVIVGIFIFLGIAIFVAGVFTIGTQRKTFAKSIPVKVIFDDVNGLQEGNNVWLSGVKIGTVKKISFHGDTRVEIVMSIDREAQSHITKDAMAKISSDGFIGNRIVVIYGGTATAGKINGNDYLVSQKTVSTDDLLANLQENNKNLLEITANLKVISKNIREGKGTIGKLINDPSIANNLRATMGYFRQTAVTSERTIARINQYVDSLNSKGTLVNELMTDTVAYASIKMTLENLKQSSANIAEFAENLKTAGKSLDKTDNPAGVLLHDEQIASDMKTITRNLNTASQELDEDLKALQSNFFFKGYFKDQEKQRKKEEQKKIEEQKKKNKSQAP